MPHRGILVRRHILILMWLWAETWIHNDHHFQQNRDQIIFCPEAFLIMFKTEGMNFSFSSGHLKTCPILLPLSTRLYPPKEAENRWDMSTYNVEMELWQAASRITNCLWWESEKLYKEINFVSLFKDSFSSLTADISVWIKNYTSNAV